jgi:hypothetical protein
MRDVEKDLELTRLATPGPWKWEVSRLWDGYSGLDGKDDAEVLYPDHCNDGDGGAAWFGEFPSEADAAFIAASREALPYWLGEAKRLREALKTISNPVGHIIDKAIQDGLAIDGLFTAALSNNAEWLKGIARQALGEDE